MKTSQLPHLGFIVMFFVLTVFSSCSKDGTSNCETVVNNSGPAFIKVVNNRSETIEVYLGDFIPFGSDLRAGRCEIYGVPAQNRSVEISSGTKSREVDVNAQSGQTVTITVGQDFF